MKLRLEYSLPYGSSYEVDPLIGVETQFGWITQRLGNFTDHYIVTTDTGTQFIQDIRTALFYLDESRLGNLEQYAREHLVEFTQALGLPITIYSSRIPEII